MSVQTPLPADTSLYQLFLPKESCDEQVFDLDAFTGTFGLGGDFSYCLTFTSHSLPVFNETHETTGCLSIRSMEGARQLRGDVSVVSTKERAAGGRCVYQCEVALHSPLQRMHKIQHSRVWVDTPLATVIAEVLAEHHLSAKVECRVPDLRQSQWTQFEETDWDFVMRLLSRWGWTFYWDAQSEAQALILTDCLASMNTHFKTPRALDANLPHQMVAGKTCALAWSYSEQAVADSASVLSPNFSNRGVHSAATQNKTDIAGIGEECLMRMPVSAGYTTTMEPNLLRQPGFPDALVSSEGLLAWQSQLRAERLDCARGAHHLTTDEPSLIPGTRVQVRGGGEPFNQTLRVVELREHGQHEPHGQYQAELTLQPASLIYRPPFINAPQRPSTITATIERKGKLPTDASVAPAHLDAEGRYRVRYDFDERAEQKPAGQRSTWLRFAGPFGGHARAGMHYPMRAGTTVRLGFQNGDADCPVILGSMPAIPTVTRVNATEHVLRTPQGSEFGMQDKAGQQRVWLSTHKQEQAFVLDKTREQATIKLHSETGEVATRAGTTLTTESLADHRLESNNTRISIKGQHSEFIETGSLAQFAGDSHDLTAAQDMQLQAETESMHLQSGGLSRYQGTEGLSLVSTQSDLQFQSDAEIACSAKEGVGFAGSGSEDLFFGNANGGVTIKADGTVAFSGPSTTIHASSIQIYNGSSVNSAGGGGAAISKAAEDLGFTRAVNAPQKRGFLHEQVMEQEPGAQVEAAKIHEVEELLYAPRTATFYALSAEELEDFEASAGLLDTLMAEVIAAEQAGDETQIEKAKIDLNKHLAPVLKGKGTKAITEVIGFGGKKWRYVQSDKIKNHFRSYQLDSDMRKRSVLNPFKKAFFKNGQFDKTQFMRKVKQGLKKQNPIKFKFKQDYGDSASEWGASIEAGGETAKKGHKASFKLLDAKKTIAEGEAAHWTAGSEDDANAHMDWSADAALLRYTAGLSCNAGFNLKARKLNLKAGAEATYNLAQAKISTSFYCPNKAGFQLCFHPLKRDEHKQLVTNEMGMPVVDYDATPYDFGAFRAEFEMGLEAYAGASVLANVSVQCTLPRGSSSHTESGTPGKPRLQLKGSNKKHDKQTGQEVSAGINAFAGATAGCEAGLAICWKNPEPIDVISKRESAKAQAATRDGDWREFAKLSGSGSAAVGGGVEGEFEVGYDAKEAKFIIKGKAGVILGVGFCGEVETVVEVEHIWEFVMFVYHKIKAMNFKQLGFIEPAAFIQLSNLLTRYVISEIDSLESIVEMKMQEMRAWWNSLKNSFTPGSEQLKAVERVAERINAQPERLHFTLPEVKGRLLYLLTDETLATQIQQQAEAIFREIKQTTILSSNDLTANFWNSEFSDYELKAIQQSAYKTIHCIEEAILNILSYVQCKNDFDNVLQHMTLSDGKVAIEQSESRLYNGLGIYGRSKLKGLQKVREVVDEQNKRVTYPVQKMLLSQEDPRPNQAVIQDEKLVNIRDKLKNNEKL